MYLIERTIAVSSGCTTMVGARATTLPCAVTTLSTLITVIARKHRITMLPTVQLTPRAMRGTGALTIAVDGD